MTTLKIIVASTRPGSSGPAIAGWIAETARRAAGFGNVEVLDLAAINLPFLDEPHHPKSGRYTKAHTIAWAHDIDTADALVIVTPEYNHGFPAPLKNAIDWHNKEWHAKPVGFVSYGGLSGGLRAVEQLRVVLAELHAVTIRDTVSFHGAWARFDADAKTKDPAADAAAKTSAVLFTNTHLSAREKFTAPAIPTASELAMSGGSRKSSTIAAVRMTLTPIGRGELGGIDFHLDDDAAVAIAAEHLAECGDANAMPPE